MEMETGGTFETFAQIPEYLEVNRQILESWVSEVTSKVTRVLDVACGVGTTGLLFLKAWRKNLLPDPTLYCLDSSTSALQLTREHLILVLPEERLGMIHADIRQFDHVKKIGKHIDFVTWGNGIHYLSRADQEEALGRIANALRPSGFFGFSTTFHKEARPEETLSFYKTHINLSARILKGRGVVRNTEEPAPEAASYLPKSDYLSLLERHGFKVVLVGDFPVRTTRAFWEAISQYGQYASGALHGYPTDEAARALVESVAPALEKCGEQDEHGNFFLRRDWFSVLAVKI